jgi:UPF0755 protein
VLAAERKLKAGEYALTTAMRPLEVLDWLESGRVIQHEVLVPEGFTAEQIGRVLEARGLASYDEFVRLARDRGFARALGVEADALEGYLFPQTYYFARRVGAAEIIRTMVAMFQATFTEELARRAAELKLTPHQVVTLASIIEKESGNAAERPLISAVFHNRMRKRIPLQSDPTVIYGIKEFDGNLTRKHLIELTPYNTYRIRGLPPGPIANPGKAALLAALYPAAADHLYFVSKNDGTHVFSGSLREHNRAVEKYQRRRAKRSST